MDEERYSRQIIAFGEEGQRKVEEATVGIVGLGGIGSHAAQGLAFLGVRSFVLIDDDLVEETNLNRLIGGEPPDAAERTPKVEVTKRVIRRIAPDADVVMINKNLRSREAIEALIGCSIIFGCVDHDAPRLILMELAAAYELVLIDSASEFLSDPETGRITGIGGRVVVARPGDFCLQCAKQIDMERAKWELASAEERSARRAHGYGLGEQAPAPAVVSLNGVVANLATTEFLFMVTGFREPQRHLRYVAFQENDSNCGRVNINVDSKNGECFTCGSLVGLRDRANIFRYALPEAKGTGADSLPR